MHHLMMLRTQFLDSRSFDATHHSDTRALLTARKATPQIPVAVEAVQTLEPETEKAKWELEIRWPFTKSRRAPTILPIAQRLIVHGFN